MSVRQSSFSGRLYLEATDGGAHGDCVTLAQIGDIQEGWRLCALSTPRAVMSATA